MENDSFIQKVQETGWSKELLYQLVDSIKDYAIFVSDLDGEIVSWNTGAENIFGYTTSQAIGQNCRMLFTKEDQAEHVPEKEKEIARTEGCAEDERWHLRRDGSHFFASGLQTPLYDENGKHTGYAKIARDLTERVSLEDALEESNNNFEVKVGKRTSELTESNDLLQSEVTKRTQSEQLRVALLRKIVRAQEDERKRIARDIHDHIGQQMTGLQLNLQIILDDNKDDSKLIRKLSVLQSIAKQIDQEVDFLAYELHPSMLDDIGLPTAMKRFVEDWSAHFKVPADFDAIGMDSRHLLPEIEINLYRIGQEALNNTSKYAKANNASVILERRDGTVSLIIEDDGVGFGSTRKPVKTGDDSGLGLLGMKERAELIGGTFQIESSPGNGTTVYVRVPVRFEDENS